MTTDEKFIKAARDVAAAEARITEIRKATGGVSPATALVGWHELAAMRRTRQRARRRMMYHWRKMMAVDARMAENAEWNAKARAEFA